MPNMNAEFSEAEYKVLREIRLKVQAKAGTELNWAEFIMLVARDAETRLE